MKTNAANVDHIARAVVGLILSSLSLRLHSSRRWLEFVGVMPLITGLAGRCPGDRLLGADTCLMQKKKPE